MIALIDSGGTNIASVLHALARLGVDAALSADPKVIKGAERVILPGVGAAKPAMSRLQKLDLIGTIRELTQPVMGICLGMQLLFSHSEEGDVDMLDIMPGTVSHFTPAPGKTIPHMGWSKLALRQNHDLVKNISNEDYFYFVHSYYAPEGDYTVGTCDYGDVFSAIIARDNFMGCQFHPERSGKSGAQILQNFIGMTS